MAHNSRVFLDSSILITALLSSKGGSFYILSEKKDQLAFLINDYVLQETLAVLRRNFPKQKELENNLYLLLGFSRINFLPNPKKSQLRQALGKAVFCLAEKKGELEMYEKRGGIVHPPKY